MIKKWKQKNMKECGKRKEQHKQQISYDLRGAFKSNRDF